MNAIAELIPDAIEARLAKSLQGLAAWRWEAKLPWANRAMTLRAIHEEIAILGGLRDRAANDRKPAISEMIRQYRAFLAEHF